METSPTPPVGSKPLSSPAPAHPIQRAPPGEGRRSRVPRTRGRLTAPPRCPSLQHYSKDKGAICTKLVKPKRKQGTRSAEEELAKGAGPPPTGPRCLAL